MDLAFLDRIQEQWLENENQPQIKGVCTTKNLITRSPNIANKIYCSICLDDVNQGLIGELSCKHSFHYSCINTWLRTSASCPICRKNLILNK